MEVVIVIISWLLFGGAASYFAGQRGRDPFAWFFIGMLLGILGLLLLFLLPTVTSPEEAATKEDSVEKPKELQEGNMSTFRLKEWYYLNDSREQKGPNPYSELKGMWNLKKITDQTYVWCEGMENWKKIAEIPELKEALE